MPQGLAEAVDCQEGSNDSACFEALDALRRPINVCEAKPEGEFVKGEAEGDPENKRSAQVPLRIAGRERGETDDHQ